jgi:hypothetical protein
MARSIFLSHLTSSFPIAPHFFFSSYCSHYGRRHQLHCCGYCRTFNISARFGKECYTEMCGTFALWLEAVVVRVMMEECDVISVVAEFMVGSCCGSRHDGGV